MSRVCPQCSKNYSPNRSDQVFCSASCRQKGYIKRKYGVESKQEIPVSNSSTNTTSLPEQLTASVPSVNNPSAEMTNNMLLQLGQLLGMIGAGAPIASALPTVNSQNTVNEETSKQISDTYSKRQKVNHTIEITDPSDGNEKPEFKVSEMVKQGLTTVTDMNCFSKKQFSNWTTQQWKAVKIVNKKFSGILKGLLEYSIPRKIKLTRLKMVGKELEEFYTGIYSIVLPEDYPFFGFIRKLENIISKCLERIDPNEKVFELKLPRSLVNELLFIQLQIGEDFEGDNQPLFRQPP